MESAADGWSRERFYPNQAWAAALRAMPLLALEHKRAFFTLCAIASFCNSEGRCHPRRGKIAERAGFGDPQAITEDVAVLKALGLLEVVTRRGRSNEYRIVGIGRGDLDSDGGSLPGDNLDALGRSSLGTLGRGDLGERYHRTFSKNDVRTSPKKRGIVGASDELVALHQETTGWSLQAATRDAARAVRDVGKQNEALLINNYRKAISIGAKNPMGLAHRVTLEGGTVNTPTRRQEQGSIYPTISPASLER